MVKLHQVKGETIGFSSTPEPLAEGQKNYLLEEPVVAKWRPESANMEEFTTRTGHEGSSINTEEKLVSVNTEVGQTCE